MYFQQSLVCDRQRPYVIETSPFLP